METRARLKTDISYLIICDLVERLHYVLILDPFGMKEFSKKKIMREATHDVRSFYWTDFDYPYNC